MPSDLRTILGGIDIGRLITTIIVVWAVALAVMIVIIFVNP